ncbi:hypothetical protein GH984_03685 [Spiribacter sp. C176]|uniref:Helix-turn-helix domain-containing protein n=1 Tax=Spiribacter salilacus TaxID=2664894 RepID=A0A6N7QTZ7_9GAMM|nr:helix-turn-helix domain-containing protein [Spiribacter salilacus]MRH77797.1 hypothetical protein [Spiribacter salilacus]
MRQKKSPANSEANAVHQQNTTLSLVQKLEWLQALAKTDPPLRRSEITVAITLANMANAKTGVCWPSLNTLAQSTNADRRSVVRAINQLSRAGFIQVERTQGRSNVYRLNPTSDTDVTPLVTPMSPTSDASVTPPVTPMSPKSMNESDKESVNQSEQPQSDKHPQFWQAGVKRAQVRECERRIDALVASGVELKTIVDGANRWMRYTRQSNSQPMTPLKWLDAEGWRDQWQTEPVKKRRML